MIGRVFHEAITSDDVLRNGRLKHSAGQGCAMRNQIVADIARTVHIIVILARISAVLGRSVVVKHSICPVAPAPVYAAHVSRVWACGVLCNVLSGPESTVSRLKMIQFEVRARATTYLFNSMIFAIIFWSAIKRSGNFTNLLNTRRFNSLKNQYLKRNFSSFKACKNFSLALCVSGKLFTMICHSLHGCRTGPSWSCWYSGRRLAPWRREDAEAGAAEPQLSVPPPPPRVRVADRRMALQGASTQPDAPSRYSKDIERNIGIK